MGSVPHNWALTLWDMGITQFTLSRVTYYQAVSMAATPSGTHRNLGGAQPPTGLPSSRHFLSYPFLCRSQRSNQKTTLTFTLLCPNFFHAPNPLLHWHLGLGPLVSSQVITGDSFPLFLLTHPTLCFLNTVGFWKSLTNVLFPPPGRPFSLLSILKI